MTSAQPLPDPSLPDPAPPAGLVLRPGIPVLHRDATTIQVGLTPGRSARLPDTPAIRAVLTALATGTGEVRADSPEAAATLDLLSARGLAIPAGSTPEPADALLARAQFGGDGVRRRRARARARIAVRSGLGGRAVLAELLAEAGLRFIEPRAESTARHRPVAWLIVADGPVPRASIDPLLRGGVPHLLVTGLEDVRRIGPFVVPGRTACVRCVDAHEAEPDPRRPLLLEQLADQTPPPVDPVIERLALAWAVRDLVRFVEGDEPSTWSATVDIGPAGVPLHRRWLRHHHCGCAWDLLDLP